MAHQRRGGQPTSALRISAEICCSAFQASRRLGQRRVESDYSQGTNPPAHSPIGRRRRCEAVKIIRAKYVVTGRTNEAIAGHHLTRDADTEGVRIITL